MADLAGGHLDAGLALNGVMRKFAARHADEIILASEPWQRLQARQSRGFQPVNADASNTSDHA